MYIRLCIAVMMLLILNGCVFTGPTTIALRSVVDQQTVDDDADAKMGNSANSISAPKTTSDSFKGSAQVDVGEE